MNNSGEQINSNVSGNSGSNPWDEMAQVKFAGAEKKDAATIGSTIENSAERAGMKINSFVAGWQKRRAEKRQAQTDDKFEFAREKKETAADNESRMEKMEHEAGSDLEKAIADIDKTEDNIRHNEEVIKELTNATRIDGYIKSQTKQVGEVIKAGGEVLKSGLEKFKAEIIARIKIPQIKFESASDIAAKTWNEQQHEIGEARREAKGKVQAKEEARANLEAAKEALRNKVNGIGEIRQNRVNDKEKLADEKQSLRENKDQLKAEEQTRDAAREAYDTAKDKLEKARGVFQAASQAFTVAEKEKQAADARVDELKQKIHKQESLMAFQAELSNKDPIKMIDNLEERKREVAGKRQNRMEDLLFMANVESEDDLSDEQKQRFRTIIKKYDDEIAMTERKLKILETYTSARQKNTRRALDTPVAGASTEQLRAA